MKDKPDNVVMAVCRVDPPSATSQQKGVAVVGGRPRFYTKKDVRAALKLWRLVIHSGKSRGFRRFEGPVAVSIGITYPFPADWSRRRRAEGAQPKPTRPDLDNLCKVALDAATAANVWRDDAQVTRLEVSKAWGDHGELRILIRPDAPQPTPQPAPAGE